MRRRAFLSSAVTGTALLAGCSFVGRDDEGSDRIEIDELVVSNRNDQSHTVDVQVENQDATVLDERYSLDPVSEQNGYSHIDAVDVDLGEWHEEAADYTLRATLTSGAREELRLTDVLDIDCVKLHVPIHSEQSVSILAATC